MPASLLKVEEMTGKTISFYEADLTELEGIRVPFKKVGAYESSRSPFCRYTKMSPVSPYSQHKIDCVMHFGALKAVAESMQKPLEYYYNNVTGSCNLLRVSLLLFVPQQIFNQIYNRLWRSSG